MTRPTSHHRPLQIPPHLADKLLLIDIRRAGRPVEVECLKPTVAENPAARLILANELSVVSLEGDGRALVVPYDAAMEHQVLACALARAGLVQRLVWERSGAAAFVERLRTIFANGILAAATRLRHARRRCFPETSRNEPKPS